MEVPFVMNDEIHGMSLEENRVKSFKDWPFLEDCTCTPDKLAEAGFYHCPTQNEPDVVRCYVCQKELDGWEPNDEPWNEHESHTQQCPFVVLRKPEKEMTVAEFLTLESQSRQNVIKKNGEYLLQMLNTEMDKDWKNIVNLCQSLQ